MKSRQKFGNDLMDNNLHNLSVSELSDLLKNKVFKMLAKFEAYFRYCPPTSNLFEENWKACAPVMDVAR